MNRINKLFASGKKNLLSIYFCAGFPTLNNVESTIKSLAAHGVNMVEIGIPFSDPMADGVVIQNAATQALRNGMTLKRLFSQLKDIRNEVEIPLVLMGYLNPIMQYGFEQFCKSCHDTGIDGVIIPDLPYQEYMNEYKSIADRYNIRVIMLITPETDENRIRLIDDNTDGFIYMVSSASTTGSQEDFDTKKQEYFKRIDNMNLKHPRMIGFGVSNKSTFDAACANASGAIIGSKFESLLAESNGNADIAITRLIEGLKH